MSHTLIESGVFMGHLVNGAGDMIPAEHMYEACRIFGRNVTSRQDMIWDRKKALEKKIPDAFRAHLTTYIIDVINSTSRHRGWKLPETILALPWITRLYPVAKYIFWVRDPRDCIMGPHNTDNLGDFGVPWPEISDKRLQRAISWKYQYDLLNATPKPRFSINIRYEDFVLDQNNTLDRLESFLGIDLAKITAYRDKIGLWQHDELFHDYKFLKPLMEQYGYQ